MSYSDIGFNEFLQRDDLVSGQNSASSQQLDPLQADTYLPEISGNKIIGGLISSPDGRARFDVENGAFIVDNGVAKLVQLGILEDGTVGLMIKNGEGKILMHISENVNIIQSPNEHFQADFNAERILSKNQRGLPVAIFGKRSV